MAKILIVEDHPDNAELIADLLLSRGYAVVYAANGHEGVEVTRAEHPDLILMDLSLPVMDGLQATREIKADPALAAIPIIALTAHAMAGDENRALAAGCSGYVSKPIEVTNLAERIAGYLKGIRQ